MKMESVEPEMMDEEAYARRRRWTACDDTTNTTDYFLGANAAFNNSITSSTRISFASKEASTLLHDVEKNSSIDSGVRGTNTILSPRLSSVNNRSSTQMHTVVKI